MNVNADEISLAGPGDAMAALRKLRLQRGDVLVLRVHSRAPLARTRELMDRFAARLRELDQPKVSTIMVHDPDDVVVVRDAVVAELQRRVDELEAALKARNDR